MTAIIIILFITIALYKAGFAARMLQAATLENIPPVRLPEMPQIRLTPQPVQLSEREQLEKQARIIVSRMGENPDTVKYMGENLLRALINDYTTANK